MIQKIKTRMANEEGFTLIELLVVIIILGILVAIAVPAYLSFAGKAKVAAGQSNVRSAIPAAEEYYQDSSAFVPLGSTTAHVVNTYDNISHAVLAAEAPGVSPNVKAGPVTGGTGYCIQDTEPGGLPYSYTGGVGGTATITQAPCAVTVS